MALCEWRVYLPQINYPSKFVVRVERWILETCSFERKFIRFFHFYTHYIANTLTQILLSEIFFHYLSIPIFDVTPFFPNQTHIKDNTQPWNSWCDLSVRFSMYFTFFHQYNFATSKIENFCSKIVLNLDLFVCSNSNIVGRCYIHTHTHTLPVQRNLHVRRI